MQDVFSQAIVTANDHAAVLDETQMAELKQFIAKGNKRLCAVKLISAHANTLVSEALSAMLNEYNDLTQPGGNCYPSRRLANAKNDIEHIFRLVSYAFAAGNRSLIDDKCAGLKDLFTTLGVPQDPTLHAFNHLKAKTLEVIRTSQVDGVPIDDAGLVEELSGYFDLAISYLD